jgi:aspartyl-tRNA(Asn)/glutamyl-tRNA(Gln) amidotransferase subunit A
VRTLISRDYAAAFEKVDVIVSATTPFVAFPFGSRTSDPYQMYLADLFTIPVNLYGGPAISVPCGLSEGLPVGFQVSAPTMADDRMYRVAAALESVIPAPTPPAL